MGKNVYGTGTVYQRKDGRYVAKIYVDGKARTKYAKTEKAAWLAVKDLWRETARGERQHGAPEARPIPEPATEPPLVQTITTVRDFAEEWLASASLKATTQESYRNNLKAHVFPIIGDRRLETVTASDVASLIATIQKTGSSERTAQYAYSLTRRLFQVATEWEIIPANPAAKVKRPQVHREEKTIWSQAQAAAFIAYAKQGVAVWDDLFLVALLSGLRLGELLGLEWQDVNWQDGTIAVKRNLVELDGGVFKMQTPKSKASVRTVSLPKDALDALRGRQKGEGTSGAIFRRDAGRDRHRFNGIDANPIPRRNAIREAFPRFMREGGCPVYLCPRPPPHAHQLTRTCRGIRQGGTEARGAQ